MADVNKIGGAGEKPAAKPSDAASDAGTPGPFGRGCGATVDEIVENAKAGKKLPRGGAPRRCDHGDIIVVLNFLDYSHKIATQTRADIDASDMDAAEKAGNLAQADEALKALDSVYRLILVPMAKASINPLDMLVHQLKKLGNVEFIKL